MPEVTGPLPIHIVNPFWDAYAGSELRALALHALLKPHAEVHLWSAYKPDRRLHERHKILAIAPQAGQVPRRGTLIFVGIYADPGAWVEQVKPSRIIVVINTLTPRKARVALARIEKSGVAPEIVYASEALKAAYPWPGIVEASVIDLREFVPQPRPANPRFTVGRLSRDVASKHHSGDIALYRRLLGEDFAIRVMGGEVLRPAFADVLSGGLELLPAGAEPASEFLRSLDAFLYRTGAGWFESYGRVVFEAMAAGLPVVLGRDGGYAAHIVCGENGFLFDTGEDALAILRRLRDDSALRARIGAAARATVEKLYAPGALETIRGFYLGPAPRQS